MYGRLNRTVSKALREEIIRVYLEDADAGTQLAKGYGLSDKYAYHVTRERGLLELTRHIPKAMR